MLFIIIYAVLLAIYILCLLAIFEAIWIGSVIVVASVLGMVGVPALIATLVLYFTISLTYAFSSLNEAMYDLVWETAAKVERGLHSAAKAAGAAYDSVVEWLTPRRGVVLELRPVK